eukprot:14038066-Heterocapsa_arctica.AAC.1
MHNGRVQEALNAMLGNDIFGTIKTDEPLIIDKMAANTEQGTGAVFDPEEYGITGTGYSACCNLFWLNVFNSVVAGVPVNRGQ